MSKTNFVEKLKSWPKEQQEWLYRQYWSAVCINRDGGYEEQRRFSEVRADAVAEVCGFSVEQVVAIQLHTEQKLKEVKELLDEIAQPRTGSISTAKH
ncbi:MAG TPA: hypothetical protein VJJ20_01925 [Candidatus Paceibacterota bacterium]